jgi:hypothetical protein
MTRRTFLHILGFLSALGLTRPARALAKLGGSSAPDPLALKLAKFFVHKDSASMVGREYLRSVPEEEDARLLVDLICSGQVGRRETLLGADLKELREWLRGQQRLDFEHGRIVKVQGWILSETEVRLCALAALL